MRRCRGGLVFKAHRLSYHATLGSRVIKKKKEEKKRFNGWARTSVAGSLKEAEREPREAREHQLVPLLSSLEELRHQLRVERLAFRVCRV